MNLRRNDNSIFLRLRRMSDANQIQTGRTHSASTSNKWIGKDCYFQHNLREKSIQFGSNARLCGTRAGITFIYRQNPSDWCIGSFALQASNMHSLLQHHHGNRLERKNHAKTWRHGRHGGRATARGWHYIVSGPKLPVLGLSRSILGPKSSF